MTTLVTEQRRRLEILQNALEILRYQLLDFQGVSYRSVRLQSLVKDLEIEVIEIATDIHGEEAG
jgi:hypothetical protein